MRHPRAMLAALAVTCLAFAPRPGEAQVLLGMLAGGALSSDQFNIGFDIGMNIGTLSGLGSATRTTSPMFGLFGDWRFAEHLHLTVGLLPISGHGARELAPQPIGDPALDSLVAGGTMTRTLHTVDIPIILKYAPRRFTGPRIGIGPQVAFVTGATDRYTAQGTTGTPAVVERDIGGGIANMDAGVAFDVEWRWPLLAIGVRYYHGLTDLGLGTGGAASYSRVLAGSGRIALGRRPSQNKPPEH